MSRPAEEKKKKGGMMGKKAELEKRVTSLERLEEARAVNLHSDDCPCTSCRVRREDLARFYALSRRVEDLERVTRQRPDEGAGEVEAGLPHAAPRLGPNAPTETVAERRTRDHAALCLAFQAAGSVIARGDNSDYLNGLWDVVRAIRPDIADADDPIAALRSAVFQDDEG